MLIEKNVAPLVGEDGMSSETNKPDKVKKWQADRVALKPISAESEPRKSSAQLARISLPLRSVT
ncbi:MAG: hypothetical protein JNJ77_18735 [Planctomycetia bacterium]|nr:hypothetical protein [Planctomycetia bacterium]